VEVAVWESPDQGDDGAPGRVQGEDHGDTPAVKGENVADDGSQWEVEGGDHRVPFQLDHRGQPPPFDAGPRTAAAAGTWWAVSSGACACHRRASIQDGGGGGASDPCEVRPLAPRRPAAPGRGLNQDIGAVLLSIAVVATTFAAAPSRRQGRVARRQAATGQWRWPPADARPARRDQTWWIACTVPAP
jgi:hypothetical protein